MRFFTHEWISGELNDEEYAAVLARYREHVAAIAPRLPPEARELATDVNLHDGRVREVVVDRRESAVRLGLRCGDLQAGYCDLDLRYLGVPIDQLDLEVLKAVALDLTSEALYDEVDLLPEGGCLHSILFWSNSHRWLDCREIRVPFRGLEIARGGAVDRGLAPVEDRFVLLGEDANRRGPVNRP